MAHHIRNSATGARLALQLHRRRCAPAGGDESLDVALRQLELTEQQVRGLLTLSPSRPQGRPGELAEVVRELPKVLEPICRHARVAFECRIDEPACAGTVRDADELRAALVNLAWNAVEATAGGTHVERGPSGVDDDHAEVRRRVESEVGGNAAASNTPASVLRPASADLSPRVRIDVRRENGSVVIDVADNGPGPAQEVVNAMFEPFVSSKPEGVGLGLTLARRAAQTEGGEVTWRRHGGETVFSVRLPRNPGVASAIDGAGEGRPCQAATCGSTRNASTGAAAPRFPSEPGPLSLATEPNS
jgi:signal transduction histidine kinase